MIYPRPVLIRQGRLMPPPSQLICSLHVHIRDTYLRQADTLARPIIVHVERYEPEHGDIEADVPPRVYPLPRVLGTRS